MRDSDDFSPIVSRASGDATAPHRSDCLGDRGSVESVALLQRHGVTSRSAKRMVQPDSWRFRRPSPDLVEMSRHAYASAVKAKSQKHVDSHGRTWLVTLVPSDRADDHDARFWERMSPEQRVVAVQGCLESALKARGMTLVPRLRRVARVVKGALPTFAAQWTRTKQRST
jgi:hypothetical protein